MKVSQSCLTLCNPMDYTVHGILQARILEWISFPFSRGSSQPGIEPRSPVLKSDFLPVAPPGKLKERGVMKSQDSNSVTVLKAVRTSGHLKKKENLKQKWNRTAEPNSVSVPHTGIVTPLHRSIICTLKRNYILKLFSSTVIL